MKNAATAVETYAIEHDGSYTLIDGANEDSVYLEGEGYNNSAWIAPEVFADNATFCTRGRHEKFPTSEFVYRGGTGVVELGRLAVVDCDAP